MAMSDGGEPSRAGERRLYAPGSAASGTRARVVILGAGFGGLACARKLNRTALDVLLLDRRGYHLFTPLLYQVATALLTPSDIAYPLRTIFRKSPNVRVWQTTVTGLDLRRQVVNLSPGEEVTYDYLVLATGSTANYFGNEQLARDSIGLKSLDEATRLRNHVLACLERADREEDPIERRALLSFVVAGGGPTGVEYSGALGELLKLVARKDFPAVSLGDTRIVLVEGQDRLLGTFSEHHGRYAERVLTKRGIEVGRKPLSAPPTAGKSLCQTGPSSPRARSSGRAASGPRCQRRTQTRRSAATNGCSSMSSCGCRASGGSTQLATSPAPSRMGRNCPCFRRRPCKRGVMSREPSTPI